MGKRVALVFALIVGASLVAEVMAQDRSKIIRRTSNSSSPIQILDAVYGQDERTCDARDELIRACDRREACEVVAGSDLCGDPYRGVAKELFVAYTCGDGRRTLTVAEGDPARIYCSVSSSAPVAGRPASVARRARNSDYRGRIRRR